MKIKILCKDGVIQTYYTNKKRIAHFKRKYGKEFLKLNPNMALAE